MSTLGQLRSVTFGPDSVGENEQGFLTNKNRFVDRFEAYKIALSTNQITEGKTHHNDKLYSEDIY